mmetsp:Transcript_31491/g.86120  ORF Transcript_31491/g.86120 Transcript_31491/m.86120 type:complete len:202 (+) Transcript_31491:114-719(+)
MSLPRALHVRPIWLRRLPGVASAVRSRGRPSKPVGQRATSSTAASARASTAAVARTTTATTTASSTASFATIAAVLPRSHGAAARAASLAARAARDPGGSHIAASRSATGGDPRCALLPVVHDRRAARVGFVCALLARPRAQAAGGTPPCEFAAREPTAAGLGRLVVRRAHRGARRQQARLPRRDRAFGAASERCGQGERR